jgi:hypothetical protein
MRGKSAILAKVEILRTAATHGQRQSPRANSSRESRELTEISNLTPIFATLDVTHAARRHR